MCAADAEGSRTRTRERLSCERIVDAAVHYIDANCLDDLSMRRLGAELGVEAMSLYRYFPSKAALLEAVVSRMLRDVCLPTRAAGQGPGQGTAALPVPVPDTLDLRGVPVFAQWWVVDPGPAAIPAALSSALALVIL